MSSIKHRGRSRSFRIHSGVTKVSPKTRGEKQSEVLVTDQSKAQRQVVNDENALKTPINTTLIAMHQSLECEDGKDKMSARQGSVRIAHPCSICELAPQALSHDCHCCRHHPQCGTVITKHRAAGCR